MMKAIAAFLQKRDNKKPKQKYDEKQVSANELKPKWPLNWIPPKDLRHPAWRYD